MTTPYTPYRRTLAWVGFATLYVALPITLAAAIYLIDGHLSTTTYDRAQFLSDAHTRP